MWRWRWYVRVSMFCRRYCAPVNKNKHINSVTHDPLDAIISGGAAREGTAHTAAQRTVRQRSVCSAEYYKTRMYAEHRGKRRRDGTETQHSTRSVRVCTHGARCKAPNARRAWSMLGLRLSSGPHPHYRARTRLVHAGGGSSPCLSTRGGPVEFSACSGSRQRRTSTKIGA